MFDLYIFLVYEVKHGLSSVIIRRSQYKFILILGEITEENRQ